MTVLLHDKPREVTAEELAADLGHLPPWRRKKALSYRFDIDRVLSAKAYLLLCRALEEVYGIKEPPEFEYIANGKPVLAERKDIHFNLSHCRNGVMCVVGDSPVGCDIEDIPEELDLGLCHACFNDREIAGILDSEDPRIAFTRLWTMKEALLKLSGEGLTDDLPELLDGGICDKVEFRTEVSPERGYVQTVCTYRR